MERDRMTGRALTGATSFVVAIGVLMVVLVASVMQLNRDAIESRAVTNAQLLGATVTEALVVPTLSPTDLTVGATVGRRASIRGRLGEQLRRTPFEAVTVHDRDGVVLISDEPAEVDTDGTGNPAVRSALDGEVATDVVDADGAGPMLEVFVPIRIGASDRVLGVAVLDLPFGSTLAQVDADVNQLARTLSVGLVLLWGVVTALAIGRFRTEARTRWLADHDELTSLPNRTGFARRLDGVDGDGGPAVLLLDIDGFKDVNDTYGHGAGDVLLVELGRRWSDLLRDGDVVSRLGGDEFAVLVRSTDVAGLDAIARRLRESAALPVALRPDAEVVVSVSVGAALGPVDGADHTELLRRADLALHRAKRLHLGVARYDPASDAPNLGRLGLLADLRRAIEDDQLVLHHQPQLDAASGRVLGLEALVRWQHPERGLLYPDEFVPLAEQSGMAPALTAAVVRLAADQLTAWRATHPDLCVAVNLSTRDLLTDEVVATVSEALRRTGLPPGALELEVTETAAMVDQQRSLQRLHALAGLGVRLAVDDYGTGHATLGYLARLPVDVLKIDRTFVMAHHEPANRAIVESTIDLGHRLGLAVVAEGVEDEDALRFLRAAGCDVVQGYHFSRPVPADEVLGVVERLEQVVSRSGEGAAST